MGTCNTTADRKEPLLQQQQQQQEEEENEQEIKEEEALLHNYVDGCPGCSLERRKLASNGAPKRELAFVAFMVLCNSLPLFSLFPFVYFMVRDFGIAKSDTRIGTYAGYLGSALMLGRFLTSTPWGMVADRYGRKPVLITGTASIIVFNTLFGFSKNFWLALASRFLLGFTNGMLGAVRAYASEICSVEQQALGLTMVGTMWGVGLVVGPAIGGYLAQPSEKYPGLFPSGSLFDMFPYALPCVCISIFASAGLISSFWLPESLHNHSRVYGGIREDAQKIREDEGIKTGNAKSHVVDMSEEVKEAQKPLWKNWGTIAAITFYCLWGLHDMAYSEIFSLWAVSPQIYGGLGFSTTEVGNVLAASGAALLLFQLSLFPRFTKLLGAIGIARLPAAVTIPLLAVFPLISHLNGTALWIVLVSASMLKNVLSACVATGSIMLINNSVVMDQRGAANGVSMSLMSLFKAIGPASAGALFSWAQERTDASFLPGMWMVFFILDMLCVITLLSAFEPVLPQTLNHPLPEATVKKAEMLPHSAYDGRMSRYKQEVQIQACISGYTVLKLLRLG